MKRIWLPAISRTFIALSAVLLFGDMAFAAEIHVWTDRDGHRNVSNIPPHGFDKSGKLRRQYDPNSIQFQHFQMRRALEGQAERLALEASQENPSTGATPSEVSVVRAPKEGIMGLRELIQLERRGGRYLEQ